MKTWYSTNKMLKKLLKQADSKRLFLQYKVTVQDSYALRPAYEYQLRGMLHVFLPRTFLRMDDEILLDVFKAIVRCTTVTDVFVLPETAKRYFLSDAYRTHRRRRHKFVLRNAGITDIKHVEYKKMTDVCIFLLPPSQAKYLADVHLYRYNADRSKEHFITESDYMSGDVLVSNEAFDRTVPLKLRQYILYREMCCVCSYSLYNAKVNVRKFRYLLARYPEWEKYEMACEMVGWKFRVGL